MRASPLSPVPLVAQPKRIAAPPSCGVSRMMNVPFADLSPDRDDHSGEPKPSELLATRPKATFQWPPDCPWPFLEQSKSSPSEQEKDKERKPVTIVPGMSQLTMAEMVGTTRPTYEEV